MKQILQLILVLQFISNFSCSPSKAIKIDKETKLALDSSKKYVSAMDLTKIGFSKISIKKDEEIWVYRNSKNEIIVLSRRLITIPSNKIINYYFDHNTLICSDHFELNRAKVKNGIYAEQKQYFFYKEKTIQTLERELKSKNLSEDEIQLKLVKKSWKNFKANSFIYHDEIALMEKLKTLINIK
ncbi:MAG: hypothetical protein ABI851_09015 [Saprospiraceae bacterium]